MAGRPIRKLVLSVNRDTYLKQKTKNNKISINFPRIKKSIYYNYYIIKNFLESVTNISQKYFQNILQIVEKIFLNF